MKQKISSDFCSTIEKTVECNKKYSFETINEIANWILGRLTTSKPKIGIICGSGLNDIGKSIYDKQVFAYEDIPNFPISTVEGHCGNLIFGKIFNKPIICMQGRFHAYEGYPLLKCAMPIRIMKLLGVHVLIVTNAAGALNPDYKVGDVMIIEDHINMPGFSGNNPLIGPNDERFGPRFPSMSKAYSSDLINIVVNIADDLRLSQNVRRGVYMMLGGPTYESPAEVAILRKFGADAVGMSTCHEVLTAVHSNIRVFGMSMITNKCITKYDEKLTVNHEEVLNVGKKSSGQIELLVKLLIKELDLNQIEEQLEKEQFEKQKKNKDFHRCLSLNLTNPLISS
ncbi:hypothetical protein SNEBB_007829 [Seison nebaliae]|nr:hypothetical protein SNEBB_007829 [Seison nebaliae]